MDGKRAAPRKGRRVVFVGDGVPTSRQRGGAALLSPLWEGAVGAADWGREKRGASLPPSALRADTSLSEGGEGRRIPTPVFALARNDRERADRVVRPYKAEQEPHERGRRGRRPLQAGQCGHRPLQEDGNGALGTLTRRGRRTGRPDSGGRNPGGRRRGRRSPPARRTGKASRRRWDPPPPAR